MRESIHKYFKIGLVSYMAYPPAMRGEDPGIVEAIKKIACDDYFDAIEVCWIKDTAKREDIKKILDVSHLTVCYGAQPNLLTSSMNTNDLNEEQRQKAEDTLIDAIDEAYYLGAKTVAFLSGKWQDKTKDQSYAQLLKTTRNLCEYAASKNIMVELEVFDYDIAKSSLIGPAPYAARFAADIRSTHNNFGLMVDLSHIPMTHETPAFVIRTLRPYITHLHVGNTVCQDPSAVGYGDEHQRFGFPGSSNDTEQVLEYLQVIKDEGFFNANNPYVLSLEVKPWKDEDPDIVVTNAKRVLNHAWALLND